MSTLGDDAFVVGALLDALPLGIVVLTPELDVLLWNRWMEDHSRLARSEVVGKNLAEIYPSMELSTLKRRANQVVTVGNVAFFDPRVQGQLFPFSSDQAFGSKVDYMPQRCMMAPLALETGPALCMAVIDETGSVSAELRLKQVHAELLERSRRDALTQVFNRAYFYERLANECRRAQRYPAELCVILLDLDHFKHINDTHGHLAGDTVLRAAADTLQRGIRDIDLLGRYGGEEFAILLPQTALAGAEQLADRLRVALEVTEVAWRGAVIRLTGSFGIALSTSPHEPDRLLSRADAALYVAKNRGRNQWHSGRVMAQQRLPPATANTVAPTRAQRLGSPRVARGTATARLTGHVRSLLDHRSRSSLQHQRCPEERLGSHARQAHRSVPGRPRIRLVPGSAERFADQGARRRPRDRQGRRQRAVERRHAPLVQRVREHEDWPGLEPPHEAALRVTRVYRERRARLAS